MSKSLLVTGKFGQVSGPYTSRVYPRSVMDRELERLRDELEIETRHAGRPFAHRLHTILRRDPSLLAAVHASEPGAVPRIVDLVFRKAGRTQRICPRAGVEEMIEAYVEVFARLDMITMLGALGGRRR